MARFCSECGAKRDGDAAFCENCGHAFEPVPEAAGADVAATPAAAAVVGEAPPPAVPLGDPIEEPPAPRRAVSRPVIAGAAVLLIALAGAGAWKAGLLPFGAPHAAAGTNANYDLALMPIGFGNKCGFVGADGKLLINPQYDGAGFFLADLGVAPVKIGDKWGLIDRSGQYTANPQFDYVNAWGNPSVLFARAGDRWGIIDKTGNYLVNPQFTTLGGFDARGRALAGMAGKVGLIDHKGNFVLQPQFDEIGSTTLGGVTEYFRKGLAAARQGDKWGYIDESGKWVINPQFGAAGLFAADGLAAVQIASAPAPAAAAADQTLMGNDVTVVDNPAPAPAPPRWGYIDTSGKIVVQPQFDQAGEFSGAGLAPVAMGTSWGYVDEKGVVRINPQYSWASAFVSGPYGWLARVAVPGEANAQGVQWKYGFIDPTGAVKIAPQFGGLEDFDENGRAAVTLGNLLGLVDGNGRLVVNPLYDRLQLVPGAGRYIYARKADANATSGTYEMGQMDSGGKVLSTVRGGLCPAG